MDITTNRNTSESISKVNDTAKKVINWPLKVGIALILIGAILTILSFKSILFAEIRYLTSKKQVVTAQVQLNTIDQTEKKDSVTFLSPKFGLAIPRIDANANVIPNISTTVYSEYNKALESGVAHAKGTALPGQNGNVFLFAHSAVNFYESGKYNVYFYLLPKMKKGDPIYVSFEKQIFKYEVEEVKIVKKSEVKYLGSYKDYNTLTLMTCWPAGIDLNRVILTAKEVDTK